MNSLETRLAGTNIKHAAVVDFPINLHGVVIFGKYYAFIALYQSAMISMQIEEWYKA